MPAATIVAACISAETGVGPSMASGSQTCSGNWALLPIAPQKTRAAAMAAMPQPSPPPNCISKRPAAPCWSTAALDHVEVEGAVLLEAGHGGNAGRVSDGGPDHEDAEQEAEVPHAVGHERLLGGLTGGVLLPVVADQQVRADADQLPEDEGLEEVGREHDAEHREDEERELAVEAAHRLGSPCM